jgi:hypothetical protein
MTRPTHPATSGDDVRRSIDDVLSALDLVIERARDTGDAAGYFAVLYRKVTASVKEGLAAGTFDDAARMERLDALFAERYLDAVTARDAGQPTTASWQLTFDASGSWRPLVLQHLLVGINAHINLDLGIAAARCAPGPELDDLRRDFDRINAILAAMIGSIQDDLRRISPWMGLLDRIGARTQTEIVRFSIVTARAGAWRFAQRLAVSAEDEWQAAIADRDRRVADVGRRVLHPGPWMSSGLVLVRVRERGDVRANLDVLLGVRPPSLAEVEATLEGGPRFA